MGEEIFCVLISARAYLSPGANSGSKRETLTSGAGARFCFCHVLTPAQARAAGTNAGREALLVLASVTPLISRHRGRVSESIEYPGLMVSPWTLYRSKLPERSTFRLTSQKGQNLLRCRIGLCQSGDTGLQQDLRLGQVG